MNVLRKAAESLPGHWHKGSLSDGSGENFCAVGHMYNAIGVDANQSGICIPNDDMEKQWNFADDVLREFTNGKFDSIPKFNDAPETREEDVIAFLEKAAVRWDEKSGLTD